MKHCKTTTFLSRALVTLLTAVQVLLSVANSAIAATSIADVPLATTSNVPPNMMLTLSVEFPTGVVAAYNDNRNTLAGFECPGRTGPVSDQNGAPAVGVCYFDNRTYLGYFDPKRCYVYNGTAEQFEPTAVVAGPGANQHQCDGTKWSGNYLNWATMHAIDEFRWALTGGDRVVDTAAETVLEKSRHTGQQGYQQFPVKRVQDADYSDNGVTVPASAPNTISPRTSSQLFARVTNGVTPLDKAGVSNSTGRVLQVASDSGFTTAVETFLVRVKVCDPLFPESQSTCTAYGSSLKPTGLIQKNAERLRFGVASYLNDSAQSRPGGVIRSRMKFVGPNNIVPFGTPTTNANTEWNASTGVLDLNPNAADATNSGVSQSGVINYLNKFGKESGYKQYDTLSEMFYEATRYVRNLAATSAFSSGMTATMKDGFPVITDWTALDENDINNRPIQYSCQKTFFLGIADSNAWCDSDVAGSSLNSCGHGNLAAEGGLDATAQTNTVGSLEGLGNIGASFANAGRQNTFYLAGIGYWANTSDILPDDAGKLWTQGKQTAKSYWVDVRETGSADGKNQMWLAAKYGGFDDVNENGIPANLATWHTNNDTVPDGANSPIPRPDNYFTADRPDRMINSLKAIFQSVNDQTVSGAGAAVSTQNFAAGTGSSFEVRYFTKNWTGDVLGNRLSFSVDNPATTTVDEGGVPTETNEWSAKSRLETQSAGTGWNTGRRIITSNGNISTANSGVAFRWNALTATQQGYLANDQDLLNYLRGDKTNEGTKFRIRGGVLGDIVNSQATYVGVPDEPYADASNPGFSAFRTANASRTPVVYVGSNAGMLHAFYADTAVGTTTGGTELFAYVPSFVLPGPNGTPTVDGLQVRASLGNFEHKFYADGTPEVRSIDFARTCTTQNIGCTFASNLTPDWRTILVAGLRKGGKGYYAIDITDPTTFTSEAGAAGKVLWEFTDEDMGLSFGQPIIAKTIKYGWVVILTSGYNNTTGSNATNRGKGFLYVLDAKTGLLLEKIGTGVGDAANPSGFTFAAGFTPAFTDSTVTYVYGGDLNGNLWRFDLTATTGAYPGPVQFAVLRDASSVAQPVTTEPRIEIGANGIDRWVLVGTGKLFSISDTTADQTQTFYAFRDGSVTTPITTGLPLGRANLVALTDTTTGVSSAPNGWFFDLPNDTNPAQRVINDPTANDGVIAWIGQVPSTQPCTPELTSTVYAVDFATGLTRLINEVSGSAIASYAVTGSSALGVRFVKVGGKTRAVISTSKGKLEKLPGRFGPGVGAPVRLNWREILQ